MASPPGQIYHCSDINAFVLIMYIKAKTSDVLDLA